MITLRLAARQRAYRDRSREAHKSGFALLIWHSKKLELRCETDASGWTEVERHIKPSQYFPYTITTAHLGRSSSKRNTEREYAKHTVVYPFTR